VRIELQEPERAQAQLGAMFGGALVLAAALGALWLRLGMPRPRCFFRAFTGIPCPTCGSTRMFEELLSGNVVAALKLNPLMFVVGVGLVAWVTLSTLRLFLRVPSWRVILSARERGLVRILAVVALIVGWAYVIWQS